MSLIIQANICWDMQERISGTILTRTIPSHVDELHGLDSLRVANGAPSQFPCGDHQWCRMCG